MPPDPNSLVASLAAQEDQPTAGSSLTGLAKPCDREFYQRELASFIPDKVYDAHTHLWLDGEVSFSISGFSGSVGYDEYLSLMQDLHPGRKTAAMFLSFAAVERPQSAERMNEWIAKQTARNPSCRGVSLCARRRSGVGARRGPSTRPPRTEVLSHVRPSSAHLGSRDSRLSARAFGPRCQRRGLVHHVAYGAQLGLAPMRPTFIGFAGIASSIPTCG